MHEWQKQFIEMSTERFDDGRMRRQTVGCQVGRQNGKSLMMGALWIDAVFRGKRIVFTAMKKDSAVEIFLEVMERWVENAPTELRGALVTSQGKEHWAFPGRGRIKVVAPNNRGARGKTLDMIIIDEAAWVKYEFMAGANWTMATRPRAQMLMFSSAGDLTDEKCKLFKEQRELGLASLENPYDIDNRKAWFEYGSEDNIDPKDEKEWERLVPTLDCDPGVQRDFLRDKIKGDIEEFKRECLSIWTRHKTKDYILNLNDWLAVADEEFQPTSGMTVAIDVTPTHEHATIVGAYAPTEDEAFCEVWADQPGSEWVIDKMCSIRDQHPELIARVVIDKGSTAKKYTHDLRNKGFPVDEIDYLECTAYFGKFNDLVKNKQLKQRPHESFISAIDSATIRKIGDRYLWNRHGDDPICALVAATYGVPHSLKHPGDEQLIF